MPSRSGLMRWVPFAALGSLGAWALMRASSGRTTSGEVELVPGVRYRFTYVSARPVTLSEVSELLMEQPITALSVAPSEPGRWHIAFEASPAAAVRARIGNPLLPEESQIRLSEVLRLG